MEHAKVLFIITVTQECHPKTYKETIRGSWYIGMFHEYWDLWVPL